MLNCSDDESAELSRLCKLPCCAVSKGCCCPLLEHVQVALLTSAIGWPSQEALVLEVRRKKCSIAARSCDAASGALWEAKLCLAPEVPGSRKGASELRDLVKREAPRIRLA